MPYYNVQSRPIMYNVLLTIRDANRNNIIILHIISVRRCNRRKRDRLHPGRTAAVAQTRRSLRAARLRNTVVCTAESNRTCDHNIILL